MTCLRSACTIFVIVVVVGVALGQEQQKPKRKYYSESKVVDGELHISTVLPIQESKLKDLGVRVTPKQLSQIAVILTLADHDLSGKPHSTNLSFTCDGGACSCKTADPLDCVDMLVACGGPLHEPGDPSKACTGNQPTCECDLTR